MRSPQLFDGQPVMEIKNEPDRRNFLRWAGLVGVGSLVAGSAATGIAAATDTPGSGGQAGTFDTETDIGILNYALTLEYLEAEFYERGIASGILRGRTLELVEPIRNHEAEHVTAIAATIGQLGGTPVAKPNFVFPAGTFERRRRFLRLASTFEELGVTAYHGQITRISNPAVLAAGASIAGVESRHAAILADLSRRDPFPRPLEATRTMDEVLALATPFIAS